jgi:hypothetical protein
MATKTNQQMLKELSEAIDDIKAQLPKKPAARNGELTSIKLQLKSICDDQADIKEDVGMIKKKLLNPEGGVVVRVNENKDDIEELIGYTKGFLKKCEGMESEIKECKKFKNGAHKALWVVYTAIIGLAAKLLFFDGE